MTPTTEASADVSLSFVKRVAAFAQSKGYVPYAGPALEGTKLRRREDLVRWHGNFDSGGGTGEWVYPGRTVIEVPGWTWAVEHPEDCPNVPFSGSWYNREGYRLPNLLGSNARRALVLLCDLCGLECT